MTPEQNPSFTLREASNHPPLVEHECIPRELLEYPQWICWRYMERGPDKKPDKQPINPWNLHNAGVTWPNTWSTFQHALMTHLMYRQRGIQGIGFVLTAHDPFVGLDIDHCLEGEFITSSAYEIVTKLATYTEVSPSGKGLRALVKNTEFRRNTRTAELEIYTHSRFLTLTGKHFPSTPVDIRTASLDEIEQFIPPLVTDATPIKRAEMTRTTRQVEPGVLWERIFKHDQYGAAHQQRFMGNTTLDRNDHSLSVIRLLNCLARWTDGDAAQMRAMMLMSPLLNEKWFSKRGKGDWLEHQIQDALTFIRKGKPKV
jgi:putative DNA primase/helicase